jgi:ubiquinol-cytochrome c reductase cytochrome c1 subunit
MRDIKILVILIAIVGLMYYGVEPYAHHIMHPEVAPADYEFKDLAKMNVDGNVSHGKEIVAASCTSCHSVGKEGLKLAMSDADAANTYGVVPPDLSNVASIFDHNYLANLIKDPQGTTKSKRFGMPALGLPDSDIADVVAYLSSIATQKLDEKQTVEEACVRCHSIKYDAIAKTTTDAKIKEYMASVPPDLSQVIKSKGEHYLYGFINDPQKLLPGTAMPRVGLTKESEAKVVEYLEKIGDPKKEERNSLGLWVLIYMGILTVLAFAWKVKQFKEIH